MGMKITIGQLRSIIRETIEDTQRPTSRRQWESPPWETILGKFEELSRKTVPEDELADALGVAPESIDYNGTGLRVVDGVVSEMLYDTPYR